MFLIAIAMKGQKPLKKQLVTSWKIQFFPIIKIKYETHSYSQSAYKNVELSCSLEH